MASRLDRLFDAIGDKRTEETKKNLNREHFDADHDKGADSEKRFQEHAGKMLDIFSCVIKTDPDTDDKGVDFILMDYSANSYFVQVKSSDLRVNTFKQGETFQELDRDVMVVNAAKYVSKNDLTQNILKEYRRVRDLRSKKQ